MRFCFYLLFMMASYISALPQSYTAPESVVFNPFGQQYIVSFAGSKTLGMQADSSAPFGVFAQGLTSPKGIVIFDTVLYVTDVTSVKAYNLLSREKIDEFPVPGALFLNDIAADDLGYLYVSDMNAGRIIMIDPYEKKVETLIATPHQSPNGLYWDTYEQLLYVVYFSPVKSPIQSIDVETKEIKDVYKAEFTMLDGITMDYQGSVYVSSWATDSVYKFEFGFDNPPAALPAKFTSPADIYFDEFNDLLVIPCMNINKVIYRNPAINTGNFDIKLVSPKNGEENVNPSTKLSWEGIPGVNMYYISIYSVSGYSLNDSTNKTEYTPVEEFPNPDDIYWSVIAFKGDSILSSDLWSFSTAGIIDNIKWEKSYGIGLYPNPATDYLVVNKHGEDFGTSLIPYARILNLLGQCVSETAFIGNWPINLNIALLPAGIYYLELGNNVMPFIKR